MNQKSSLIQTPNFVPQVLTLDTLVHALGVYLTLSGFVLAVLSFGNYHVAIDSWVREKAPHPGLIFGGFLILLVFFNWITDVLFVILLIFISNDTLLKISEWSYAALPFIVGVPIAIIIASAILYYMSRSRGGFISSVAMIIALGSIMTLI